MEERLCSEFLTADRDAGAWATVGGFVIATNLMADVQSPSPGFGSLTNKALGILRDDGVAWTALPLFACQRWTDTHGYDGANPAGWPSGLEYIAVPDPAAGPGTISLSEGDSVLVATQAAIDGGRRYFAEDRDGRLVAVIEGDAADGQIKRWDWPLVTAPTVPELLRELGDRFVTPTTWAHDDLAPFFPCRERSRDEMRALAKGLRAP